MKFLNVSQIRQLDAIAQERFAIPGLLLMEHASLGLAEVLASLSKSGEENYLFLCGRGNNGGDGFAAARHLKNRHLRVSILLLGSLDRIREGSDAAVNARIARAIGIPIHECPTADAVLENVDSGRPDFIVDAVLGTGLKSDVRGMFRGVIDGLNERDLDITAVDVPSGLDGDTGIPLGAAVKARRTVTFAFPKIGFKSVEAGGYCGEIVVKKIGMPIEISENPLSFFSEQSPGHSS